MLARLKRAITGTSFAIQGYGNVGSHTAQCLAQMGSKIIGVSDAYGAIVNHEGIDIANFPRQARPTPLVRSSVSRGARRLLTISS